MTNIAEAIQFDEGIYQIETTDPVLGGQDGISNTQAKGLANRTQYLKKFGEDIRDGVTPTTGNLKNGSVCANTFTPGQADDKVATTAFVQGALALMSGRNAIINGGMDVSQRGDTWPLAAGAPIYTIDRWRCELGAGSSRTGTVNWEASAHRPYVKGAVHSLKAIISGAAGDLFIKQRIEGVHTLEGEKVTISFWLYVSGARTVAVALSQYINQDQINNNSPVGRVNGTINATEGAHKYSITFNLPSTSTVEPANVDPAGCLELMFTFSDPAATTLWMTQVQVEKGAQATDFERLPLAQVEFMCKRFYEITGLYERFDDADAGAFSRFISQWFLPKRVKVPNVSASNWTFYGLNNAIHGISQVRQSVFTIELKGDGVNGGTPGRHEATATITIDAEL